MDGTSQSTDDQAEVEALLGAPASYAHRPAAVERIETHGAIVFLAGDEVYKMKRAVRFPVLDFSTLERRHSACRREIELNRPAAPGIYKGLVAVTRDRNGALAIGGEGAPVEWLVHMKRFRQEDMLDQVAARGELSDEIADSLAREIARHHKTAPKIGAGTPRQTAGDVVAQTSAAFRAATGIFPRPETATFTKASRKRADALEATLAERLRHGHVRRCHGDLHLRNLVLIDGRPKLFDAIEFNEEIARIDVFYDLAFLLMDLEHAGLPERANRVFNSYLGETRHDGLLGGLSALPLYLSCRAAVRAMVAGWRAGVVECETERQALEAARTEAEGYLRQAIAYLDPPPPRLIAVGGLSGTGKTTLARALAPELGARPGAVHLRTDLERKAMFNVVQTQRLGEEAYRENVSDLVYGRMLKKAESALRAGHTVIVDGVFGTPASRGYAERLAERLGVSFSGLWLSTDAETMMERVRSRRGDASDATEEIVARQLERGTGPVRWPAINSHASLDDTLMAARRALARSR